MSPENIPWCLDATREGRNEKDSRVGGSQGHVVDGPGDADMYGVIRQYASDGHPATAMITARATAQRGVGRMLFEPERALLKNEHGHNGRYHYCPGDVHERQVHKTGHVQRPVTPYIRLVQRRRFRVRPVHGQYPIIAEREPTGQERGEHHRRDARAHGRHHILAAADVRPPALVVPQ